MNEKTQILLGFAALAVSAVLYFSKGKSQTAHSALKKLDLLDKNKIINDAKPRSDMRVMEELTLATKKLN